jgi:hypothetical protein
MRDASGTAGATSTAGGAATMPETYSVAVGASKANLPSMANQCVEIVGVLAPLTGAGSASPGTAAGGTAAGGAGNAAGGGQAAGGGGQAAGAGQQGAGGAAAGATTSRNPGGTTSSTHRVLTVTTIKTAQGCTP